jgi:hypothetical protein
LQTRGLPTLRHGDDIGGMMELLHRLYWFNIAGLVLPSLVLVWIDRRAGRRDRSR